MVNKLLNFRQLASVAEKVVEKAADVAASVGDALGDDVVVNAEIAVAAPPPKPAEPEPAVPITESLGLPELQPGDDIGEVLGNIEDALGAPLSTLQTAEQKAADAARRKYILDTKKKPIKYL